MFDPSARFVAAAFAAAFRVRFFLVRHVLQRAREIALDEELADLRGLTARQEHFDARRPAPVFVFVIPDVFGHEGVHYEAFTRETDRG